MAATDITKTGCCLLATTHTAAIEVLLDPALTYEVVNRGTNDIFGAKNGTAPNIAGNGGNGHFSLLKLASGGFENHPVYVRGASLIKLQSSAGASSVCINEMGKF